MNFFEDVTILSKRTLNINDYGDKRQLFDFRHRQ